MMDEEKTTSRFQRALEVIAQLPLAEQERLFAVAYPRLLEQRQARLAKALAEPRPGYQQDKAGDGPTTLQTEAEALDTQHRWQVLAATYTDQAELNLILGKLLELSLSQHQLRLEQYQRDLHTFEARYGMDSATFNQRFEAGELGDAMDFFEWFGLYELHQDMLRKVQHLASVCRLASAERSTPAPCLHNEGC